MQGKAIRNDQPHGVGREVCGLVALELNALEVIETLNLNADLLGDELPESGNLERGAGAQDLLDRRTRMGALVVVLRLADLADQAVEGVLHALHDLLGVLAGRPLELELLGLLVGDVEAARDGLGEGVATEREAAHPADAALGHDDVGGVGAHVHHHDRAAGQVEVQVVGDGVEDGVGRDGDHVRVEATLAVQREQFADAVLRDGEDADIDLDVVLALEGLVVPLHLVDREGNLLLGLEINEFCEILEVPPHRQLGEARERIAPGHAHHHAVGLELLAVGRQELTQREPNHGGRIDVGRGKHLLVRDDREISHDDRIALAGEPDGLQGRCADLNAPSGLGGCHSWWCSFAPG